MGEVHCTIITAAGWPLWARVKLAVAFALTPLTLLFLGRSITVTFEGPACDECVDVDEVRDEVPAD